eukprot:tig00021179_g19293.t1
MGGSSHQCPRGRRARAGALTRATILLVALACAIGAKAASGEAPAAARAGFEPRPLGELPLGLPPGVKVHSVRPLRGGIAVLSAAKSGSDEASGHIHERSDFRVWRDAYVAGVSSAGAAAPSTGLLHSAGGARVESAATTVDGTFAASLASDGSVSVHDTESGRRIREICCHPHATQVSISRDGSLVATSGALSGGSGVKVWRAADGALATELPGHAYGGTAWSADGAFLAVASSGRVHVYRTEDWRLAHSLPFGASRVAFAGGDLLAAVEGPALHVWDLRRGVELHAIPEPSGAVFSELDAAPSGPLAVVGTGGPRAYLVDLLGGALSAPLSVAEGPVRSVSIYGAGDGPRVFVAAGDSVSRWSVHQVAGQHEAAGTQMQRGITQPAAVASKRGLLSSEGQIVVESNSSATCTVQGNGFSPSCTIAWSGYAGYVSILLCNATVADGYYTYTTPGCVELGYYDAASVSYLTRGIGGDVAGTL